jgi:hypothetical protein
VSYFAAGFGDTISFGATRWLRRSGGYNHVVDTKTGSYFSGEVAGYIHATLTAGAGAFNGGARTVLYTGRGSRVIANLAKGAGVMIDDTLGGKVLFALGTKVPQSPWKAASALFAANAKGDVLVFLRGTLRPGATFVTTEKPIIELLGNARMIFP